MAKITLKGNPIHTVGELPTISSTAPDFTLTKMDLQEVSLTDFNDKKIILNIFPSVDTAVCAASVRQFNVAAEKNTDVIVLCVSMDLPFALNRFCGAEGLQKVIPLSAFRHHEFGAKEKYGVMIADGPLAGFLSRAIVIIGADKKIIYTEQVPEITTEPDYEKALAQLKV